MNSQINNYEINLENKVSERLFPPKIYIDGELYTANKEIVSGEHQICLQSIFKSKTQNINIQEDNIILIDFKANIIQKIIIGLMAIVAGFPFFVISVNRDLYPIITALVVWFVIKLLYNPIVVSKNEIIVRKL